MPSFRTGRVRRVTSERPGLQRLDVTFPGGPDEGEPTYVLTQLTGPVAVGDEVLCNTTAVELGLGTGGWHVVHANLTRGDWSSPGAGHVMKVRYTSLQADVGAAEDEGPPLPVDLGGVPVVVCTLHSQVAVVAAALAVLAPGTRLAYVMTDGGALPLALSDLVADLRDRGLLVGTVTAGHAFGGDLEAVALPSALLLARDRLAADCLVVGTGPGVVGTGSSLGTSAVEAAPALGFAAALGGRPVLCVRASSADGRERHRGVSHHVNTVLGLTPMAVDVPVPPEVADLVDPSGPGGVRHRVVPVVGPDPVATLDAAGIGVTTMGRGPEEDPLFFRAAMAAGAHAAGLLAR